MHDELPGDVVGVVCEHALANAYVEGLSVMASVCREWRTHVDDLLRRTTSFDDAYYPHESLFSSTLARTIWILRFVRVVTQKKYSTYASSLADPLYPYVGLAPVLWTPFWRRRPFRDAGWWRFTYDSDTVALSTVGFMLRTPHLASTVYKMLVGRPSTPFRTWTVLFCVEDADQIADACRRVASATGYDEHRSTCTYRTTAGGSAHVVSLHPPVRGLADAMWLQAVDRLVAQCERKLC